MSHMGADLEQLANLRASLVAQSQVIEQHDGARPGRRPLPRRVVE